MHNANCKPIGRQKGAAPRSNQAQNKQFDSIVKEYGLTKEQSRRLHDAISGKGYDREEIIDEMFYLFPELE